MSADERVIPRLREILAAACLTTRRNVWTLVAITLLVYIPVDGILAAIPIPEDEGLKAWARYFRWQRALEFWVGTIATLAVIHLAAEDRNSRSISVGESFMRAFDGYGRGLWGLFIYQTLCILGLLLFVVPGLALGTYWFFFLQAVALRAMPGRAALGVSYHLVRGRWWAFFRPLVLLYAILIVAALLLSVPSAFLPEHFLVQWAGMLPVDLVATFFTVCVTHLFLIVEPKPQSMNENTIVAAS